MRKEARNWCTCQIVTGGNGYASVFCVRCRRSLTDMQAYLNFAKLKDGNNWFFLESGKSVSNSNRVICDNRGIIVCSYRFTDNFEK